MPSKLVEYFTGRGGLRRTGECLTKSVRRVIHTAKHQLVNARVDERNDLRRVLVRGLAEPDQRDAGILGAQACERWCDRCFVKVERLGDDRGDTWYRTHDEMLERGDGVDAFDDGAAAHCVLQAGAFE